MQVVREAKQLRLRAGLKRGAIDLEQHIFQRDHHPSGRPLGTELLHQLILAALLDRLGLRDRRFLLSDIGEVVYFLIVQPLPLPLLGLNQCLFRVAQGFWRIFCHRLIVTRFLHGCLRAYDFRIGPAGTPGQTNAASVPIPAPAQQRTQLFIARVPFSPMFIALAEAAARPR